MMLGMIFAILPVLIQWILISLEAIYDSLLWDAVGVTHNMCASLTAAHIICVNIICYLCDNKIFVDS